jgi:hypothetical protein
VSADAAFVSSNWGSILHTFLWPGLFWLGLMAIFGFYIRTVYADMRQSQLHAFLDSRSDHFDDTDDDDAPPPVERTSISQLLVALVSLAILFAAMWIACTASMPMADSASILVDTAWQWPSNATSVQHQAPTLSSAYSFIGLLLFRYVMFETITMVWVWTSQSFSTKGLLGHTWTSSLTSVLSRPTKPWYTFFLSFCYIPYIYRLLLAGVCCCSLFLFSGGTTPAILSTNIWTSISLAWCMRWCFVCLSLICFGVVFARHRHGGRQRPLLGDYTSTTFDPSLQCPPTSPHLLQLLPPPPTPRLPPPDSVVGDTECSDILPTNTPTSSLDATMPSAIAQQVDGPPPH